MRPLSERCVCGHPAGYHDVSGCHAFTGAGLENDCACTEYRPVGRSATTSGSAATEVGRSYVSEADCLPEWADPNSPADVARSLK